MTIKARSKWNGPRLPYIRTEEDVDNKLSHLSKEDQALAKENVTKGPPSDASYILGTDPQLQAIFVLFERGVEGLLRPEYQMIPGSLMNILCRVIARITRNEWYQQAFDIAAIGAIPLWNENDTKKQAQYLKLGMLDAPDSDVWTEEESLMIKFTTACMTYTMTNEIYDMALETWGEKKLLRYMFFIGFVQTNMMMSTALDMRSDYGTEPDVCLNFGPEAHEAYLSINNTTYQKLMDLWDTTPSLIPGSV
ncbi:MAG: hypothetical protein HKP58_11250 [Desulfatitalea sp.]|nr:hypothetical protein [Desulfatitalea sp.]NNK00978.1 hypothetical protein [Desulfatitalea sp.]